MNSSISRLSGQMSLQEHRIAVPVVAERLGGQILGDRSGQRIGDDQRRRGQVVRLHVGRHAAFEIAVAGQHRGGDQSLVVDGLGDRRRQRTGIADAGGAAEADQVEADLVEFLLQTRLVEILGDHLAAGGERGLDPGLLLQAAPVGVAGKQPGAHQHARVGGVGAGRDRGDHHVAMAEIVGSAVDGDSAWSPPASSCTPSPSPFRNRRRPIPALAVPSGRFGPAIDGTTSARSSSQQIGEHRIGRAGVAPHALRLGVFLDQRDAAFRTAGHGQVADRLAVDREEAAGRAVFGRHVADRGAVGERHVGEAGTEELDELADHAFLAQHLRDGEHEVGRGDALLELAGQPEADHFRQQHGHRLAEHRGLSLDAADAPAEHAEAVDHGGVRIGADAGIGIGSDLAVLGPGPHRLRQIFEVDLVADAGAGRHHAEIAECLLAPFEEFVALFIALVFELDIAGERQRRAEFVDDHRMVDDQVDRHQRIDLLRIAAERCHGVAHRRQVDDRRHAGEVLHQHARRAIGDLDAGGALVGEPAGDRLDAFLGDRAAVLVAQQVFEQHLHRIGQLGDPRQPVLLRLDQAEIDVLGAADRERPAAIEAVERFWHVRSLTVGCRTGTNASRISAKVRVRSFPLSVPCVARRVPRRVGFGAKFGCHADRWHGCPGHREFRTRVPDRRKANLLRCSGAAQHGRPPGRIDAADRRRTERRARRRDAVFRHRLRPAARRGADRYRSQRIGEIDAVANDSPGCCRSKRERCAWKAPAKNGPRSRLPVTISATSTP